MAITENNFTGPEFEAALTANAAALMPIIKGVMTGRNYHLRDETEETTFKTNFEADVAKRITGDHAKKLEDDVLALTGIPKKDANEKYYDYYKRAFTEKLGSATALQTELDELKKNHKPTEADKKRIEQLENAVQEKEKALTDFKAENEKKLSELQVASHLNEKLAALRTGYKADLPATIIDVIERNAIAELMKTAKVQDDGVITFMDKDGKPIVDKATYKPQTADVLLKDMLKDAMDPGKQQAGAGGQGGQHQQQQQQQQQGGTKTKTAFTTIPGDVKTKVQLTEHLGKLGYTSDDPDLAKIVTESNLPLR